MKTKNIPIRSNTTLMRIGKVTYIVTTHFNENGRETAEQKLLRYVSVRVSEYMRSINVVASWRYLT